MNFQTDSVSLEMIREFSDAFGPSGFEDSVTETARKYASGFCSAEEDPIRNLYLFPSGRAEDPSRPLVLLDAHSDEVGMMIHSIKPNGTLRFVGLGGWNISSLPSTRVLVRNARGEFLKGVIASKPVHFMSEQEKKTGPHSIQDLVIDIGAVSAEEAAGKYHIRIGEPAVPDVRFEYDAGRDLMFGKAFDCRVGCAALIETLRRVQNIPLSVRPAGVLSSQEEMGERGASVVRNRLAPQAAVCFEGCPADDTFTEPWAVQTALKKGPMLRFIDRSMITHPRFIRFALDLAEKLEIPVQTSVREGGGTNGGIYHTSASGIPTIVIGIPVRYIHSPQGICSMYDFEASVRLAAEILKALTPDVLARF